MTAPVHPYTRALLNAVPYPDLDRRLDFASVGHTSIAASEDWAPAFRFGAGDRADLTSFDLGNGHLVLAHKSADAREFRA